MCWRMRKTFSSTWIFFFITQATSHSSRSLVASFLFSRRQNFYKFHFFLGLVIFSPFPSGGMRISSWPFENFPISNDGRRWNFNQRGKRLCKYEKYLFYIALLCVKYREIALISFYASEIFLSPTWRLYLEKFSWLVTNLARCVNCVYTYSMLKSGYLFGNCSSFHVFTIMRRLFLIFLWWKLCLLRFIWIINHFICE